MITNRHYRQDLSKFNSQFSIFVNHEGCVGGNWRLRLGGREPGAVLTCRSIEGLFWVVCAEVEAFHVVGQSLMPSGVMSDQERLPDMGKSSVPGEPLQNN